MSINSLHPLLQPQAIAPSPSAYGSLHSLASAGPGGPGAPGAPDAKQAAQAGAESPNDNDPLRNAFNEFVGKTFFSELIKAYRSSQEPSAYFNGGRAEQIFQGQLDQVLSETLSERTAPSIADPMFELFMLKRP